ncbi:hypothetical protein NE607_14700, partial [Dorea longicatena]|uniref:hypothetical protein n=1 Tax=Dorea longicatena TaxID=88431 RepID=UPI002108D77A
PSLSPYRILSMQAGDFTYHVQPTGSLKFPHIFLQALSLLPEATVRPSLSVLSNALLSQYHMQPTRYTET